MVIVNPADLFISALVIPKLPSPSLNLTTSDVVRFRDGEGSFGITSADINKSAGFTITKVDANNYTFTAAGTATASTNIGGGSISAGPVTLSP